MIRTIITVIFLAVFFLMSLPCYVIFHIIGRFSERTSARLSQSMVTWALGVIVHISGIRLVVKGKENIPDEPVLYIGNHRSYFDIVTTYPILPQITGFVAKKEIDRIALLRWWMPLLHGLTFDRDDPRSGMKMIIAAIDYVKAGYSMFIYPEGTRSKDGNMLEFKAGSFKIATRTNCAIVPVAIKGTNDIFENHIPFIKPGTVKIVFGKPVYPAKLEKEEKKRIAKIIKESIQTEIDRM